MSQELIDAMVNMQEQEAMEIAKKAIDQGEDPLAVLGDCKEAMMTVGKKFEEGEFFLPELIMAGEMLRSISEILKPLISTEGGEQKLGKVVFGTVEGDIHDIGKDIVAFMMDINGLEVIDLGIDVPPQKFVDAVKESGAKIVGLSGFLTLAFDSMKNTVEALKEAGLRDNLKIMIGGGQIDGEVCKYTGADDYGHDAMDAVRLAKGWL